MRSQPREKWLVGKLSLALATLLALTANGTAQDTVGSNRFPGKNWQMWASPSDAGFSAEAMSGLADECGKSGAASVLVVYDGAILFQSGKTATRYMCHSIRKSLMSGLCGIYAEKGTINTALTLAQLGIDDIAPKLTDDEKRATVLDLLQSRSGVYHLAAYEAGHMKVNRPERGSHPPGTHWSYNNWDFNALLTIFEKQTSEKFFEAFQQDLAVPIGLEDFRLRDGYYHHEPAKSEHPAYPFQLTARDLARIGWLMANGGRWADRQIIPETWVAESTRPHSTIQAWHRFDGYGYLWWTGGSGRDTVFSAQGDGGNSVDVMPDRKLVFVFRADTYRGKAANWQSRERIVRMVLQAQTGVPAPHAKLVQAPETEASPKPVTLQASYWNQFPLDLRRELPHSLPPEIRDEPVRIALVDGTPVLFTQRPPAMSFDLIPLAEDRFHVRDFGEVGVIERDPEGRPARFLFKSDLLLHATTLEAAGQQEAANRERRLATSLFPDTVPALPSALTPHPKAVKNIHEPGEVDRPEMVKFIVANPASLSGIVVDETAAELVGEWQYSTHTPPYVGLGYLHDMKAGKGTKSVTFTPDLPEAGWYEVRLAHCYNVRRPTRAPVTIHHADGDTTVRINQQEEPPHNHLFRSLGVFRFAAGHAGWVRVSNEGTEPDKAVIADAVQFLPTAPPRQ